MLIHLSLQLSERNNQKVMSMVNPINVCNRNLHGVWIWLYDVSGSFREEVKHHHVSFQSQFAKCNSFRVRRNHFARGLKCLRQLLLLLRTVCNGPWIHRSCGLHSDSLWSRHAPLLYAGRNLCSCTAEIIAIQNDTKAQARMHSRNRYSINGFPPVFLIARDSTVMNYLPALN